MICDMSFLRMLNLVPPFVMIYILVFIWKLPKISTAPRPPIRTSLPAAVSLRHAAPPRLPPHPLALPSFMTTVSCRRHHSPVVSASSVPHLIVPPSVTPPPLSTTGFDGLLEGYPAGMARKFVPRCLGWSSGTGRWPAARIRITGAGGWVHWEGEGNSFLFSDARCKLGWPSAYGGWIRRARVRKISFLVESPFKLRFLIIYSIIRQVVWREEYGGPI
jgi:hypothetical protein